MGESRDSLHDRRAVGRRRSVRQVKRRAMSGNVRSLCCVDEEMSCVSGRAVSWDTCAGVR